ncbi:MAG: hypothetical protein AB1847_03835 [bacterium]
MNDQVISLTRLIRWLDLKIQQAEAAGRHLVRLRVSVFSLGLLFTLGALFQPSMRLLWYALALACLMAFTILVIRHERLRKEIRRLMQRRRIKEGNLARTCLEWDRLPVKNYPVPSQHPYACDLDIVGERSLMQLLDTTISTRGTRILMDWLLCPTPNDLKNRQRLVQEVKRLPIFRDKLALEASLVSDREINGKEILARLQHQLSAWIPGAQKWAIIFWLLSILLFGIWLFFPIPTVLWGSAYLAYVLIFLSSLPALAPVFGRASSLQTEFRKLEAVFLLLEKKISKKAPELASCCAPFQDTQKRPSSCMKRISRVCDALSIQGNDLVHLGVNLLCPWDFFFACQWEKLRRQLLKEIPLWLDVLGKVEAASALATLAALNPDYTVPHLEVDQQSEASIQAEGLSHPCLAAEKRKTNSFSQKGIGSLALITGSNMSGKSTFLKTIGINLCLAQAGGFVCASSFRSSWFRIYGCLRINDSVTEGLSYFYAEVKRLKSILNAAENWNAPPVLALIDEIFKGTNNRERVIGSTDYLRKLTHNNLVGLISTHDLEVTRISDQEKGKITNFHFQETIEGGRMKFDYQLRSGICPTTNALKIMQLEGLPVGETATGT